MKRMTKPGIFGFLALAAALASAQEPPATADSQAPHDGSARAGRFRLGPIYLTPRLRIGTLGLDTNVFYTASERQADFTADGGPGLEATLPLGRSRVFADGGVSYLFFARTASQRRLVGDARGGYGYDGNRFKATVQQTYSRSYGRPSFEIDRRVLQDQTTTSGDLTIRTVGRLDLHTALGRGRIDVGAGQSFLGANLRQAFGRTERIATLGFRYRLTAKTSLIVEADEQADRFVLNSLRDADSNRVYGGFRLDSETRLFGRLAAGARFFRLRKAGGGHRQAPYVLADLSYRVGPRTLLGASWTSDLYYSAFETAGATPTLEQESFGARIEKGLVGRLDVRAFTRLTRLRSDGAIVVQALDGALRSGPRNDTAHETGADLGYRFRTSFRIGIAAVYTSRRSTFADFGIGGLLVGATATYNPGKP